MQNITTTSTTPSQAPPFGDGSPRPPLPEQPPVRGRGRSTPAGSLRDRIARHWQEPRVIAIDVARALAIIGMIGAHAGASYVFDAGDPSTWSAVVHGRSSILFAVVAGISVAFVTARAREASVEQLRAIRLGLVGRGAAVFTIGVLMELLNAPISVVLTTYGLVFVAVIPFITWSRRRLLVAAAVGAVVCPPVLALFADAGLGEGAAAAVALVGGYPVTEWLVLVFVGMVVGRSALNARTGVVLIAVGAVLAGAGYGVGALAVPDHPALGQSDSITSISSGEEGSVGPLGPVPADQLDLEGELCTDDLGAITCTSADDSGNETFHVPTVLDLFDAGHLEAAGAALVDPSPHSTGTAEIVGSGGVALAVIGLCLLVARPLRWVVWPLAALGSCSLTAYVLHAVGLSAWASATEAGWVDIGSGTPVWSSIWTGLLVAATIWSLLVGRGPLERLVGAAADRMALRSRGREAPAQAGPAS